MNYFLMATQNFEMATQNKFWLSFSDQIISLKRIKENLFNKISAKWGGGDFFWAKFTSTRLKKKDF